eukprot:5666928-Pyramimonas_sp.AAC.1
MFPSVPSLSSFRTPSTRMVSLGSSSRKYSSCTKGRGTNGFRGTDSGPKGVVCSSEGRQKGPQHRLQTTNQGVHFGAKVS